MRSARNQLRALAAMSLVAACKSAPSAGIEFSPGEVGPIPSPYLEWKGYEDDPAMVSEAIERFWRPGVETLAALAARSRDPELSRRLRSARLRLDSESSLLGAAHIRTTPDGAEIVVDLGYHVRLRLFASTAACVLARPQFPLPDGALLLPPKRSHALDGVVALNAAFLERYPGEVGVFPSSGCFANARNAYSRAAVQVLTAQVIESAVAWTVLHEFAHSALDHSLRTEGYVPNEVLRERELQADEWAFATMQRLGMSLVYIHAYLQVAEAIEELWESKLAKPLPKLRVMPEASSDHPHFSTRLARLERRPSVLNSSQPRPPFTMMLEFPQTGGTATCIWGINPLVIPAVTLPAKHLAVVGAALYCGLNPDLSKEVSLSAGSRWLGINSSSELKLRSIVEVGPGRIRVGPGLKATWGADGDFSGSIWGDSADSVQPVLGYALNPSAATIAFNEATLREPALDPDRARAALEAAGMPNALLSEAVNRYFVTRYRIDTLFAEMAGEILDAETAIAQVEAESKALSDWIAQTVSPEVALRVRRAFASQ